MDHCAASAALPSISTARAGEAVTPRFREGFLPRPAQEEGQQALGGRRGGDRVRLRRREVPACEVGSVGERPEGLHVDAERRVTREGDDGQVL